MLPSLTVAFTAGLFLGSFVPYFPLSLSCLLVLLAVASTIWERNVSAVQYRLGALFGFVLIGMLYWSGMVERTTSTHSLADEFEQVMDVSGRIVAPVQQTPDRLVMTIRRDRETDVREDYPKSIRLTWRAPEGLFFHGDRIRFRAKLRLPSGSLNPGGFDYAAYLERQGIDSVATVTGKEAVLLLQSGNTDYRWAVWHQLDRWRGSIRSAAIHSLSQPALGVYLGIIVGDRGYLDPDLREEFMVTGTVHLLSISGSHLGLVAILTFVVIRRSLLLLPTASLLRLSRSITPTRVAALVTVVPVVIYACLAGAEVATLRSLLMVLVALLTRWLGYEQRMFHALALAAAAILLQDPRAIYDISFQLSFLSVCAIAAWLNWPSIVEEEQATRTPVRTGIRWVKDAVLMSGVVTLATVPLVAFYFNQLPWLGLFTNLFAVPVTGFILVPMGLLAGLWQLIEQGSALPFASVIQWLIEGLVKSLTLAAAVPASEWHLASPSVPLMLLFYGCMGMLWWKSGPVAFRRISAVVAALLVVWWAWSPRLAWNGDRFRVTVLDVAQGDSAVLELPNGQVVLIDGGATYERFDMGRGVVAPYLWDRGIRSIDHIIATHPQLDHVGGLTWVLKHFSVRNYWGTGDSRDELFYHRLLEALAGRGLSEQMARAGREVLSYEDCRLLTMNPPDSAFQSNPSSHHRPEGHALNNRSVVTRFTCGPHTMLFAADVEQEALARMQQDRLHKPVDVLKVPHHGALSSLNQEWIASLHPRYAVISVGRHNPYGHPAAAVLEIYAAQGIPIFRTDRDGGVLIEGKRSDPLLHVRATRAMGIQPTVFSSCVWSCETTNWARLWEQWLDRI